ncbi:hypothetical protein J4N02_04735 [Propioniciclava sp. MC1595]|uniref:hypothetical protein n=1 Tax=Propioniciclava sp. MC1595 TaxID=2760308 RepID=UPI00166222C0|nr:hypothetical protein [Propioniciclava sp. MC1595]MBB1493513.1 hypothetical protein [Propioniciclava sp. MC1595]QTE26909.1 hypothetical protein J4N02_04735 [Propioniciclava sp. MC1595]
MTTTANAATISPNWRVERGRIAALTRSRTPDDPELLAARRDLKAARLAEHITEVVDAAPPLTEAQRAALAALLRAGTKGAASA